MKIFRVVAILLIQMLMPAWCCGQSLYQVLGTTAVTLDPVKVAEVKAGTPGARFWYDTNGDGKIEEVWFIDIDPRHTDANKPILVKCIDMDGDLQVGLEGDHDSDLYIVDRKADGTADAAFRYFDDDHDGDLDAVAQYADGTNVPPGWLLPE